MLAVQVTREVVVSVAAVEDPPVPIGRRSLSRSRSRENLYPSPDSSGTPKRLTLP